jgi:predicted patatin/cPLA2 family phospholipase
MKKRIALVCMGGIFHGAYVGGVIKALLELYKLEEVDTIYATSSSSGTLAYYVSKQFFQGIKIWQNYVSKKEFFHLKLKKSLDLDYLVDNVMTKIIPLDTEAIKKSKTNFFISATQTNGKKCLISTKNSNILNVIKASMSIPIIFNSVKINKKDYVDGTFCYPLPFNKEINQADIIIAILTKDPTEKQAEKKEQEQHKFLSFFLPKTLKKEFQNEVQVFDRELKKIKKLGKNKKVIMIYHPKKLPYSMINNSKEAMKDLIKIGFNDAKNNKELKETFLNKRV